MEPQPGARNLHCEFRSGARLGPKLELTPHPARPEPDFVPVGGQVEPHTGIFHAGLKRAPAAV